MAKIIEAKKKLQEEQTYLDKQVQRNTTDIKLIQHDLATIKDNHLRHIEADVREIDKKVEKIDLRLWGIMMLIVASAIANYFM